ncbi:MAG: hypothetical protein WCG34_11670 [Leptolinea sp.]
MTDQLKTDLAYIQSAVDELEMYLLSEDVIRQLPGISFSVGGILLAYQRISAANLEDRVLSEWKALEELRSHWKIAWGNKCLLEMKMRLRQWGDFILGMASDEHESSSAYRHQVRNRVILQLLVDSIPAQAETYAESIKRKDTILQKYSVDNDFVWEAQVQSGFSREKYWYLYRAMKYEKAHI